MTARPVTFRFRAPHAQSVHLAGDFNDWSVTATPMARAGEVWQATVALAPGRYEYKFHVDGRDWWNDPEAPKTPNVWGSENSYLDVA